MIVLKILGIILLLLMLLLCFPITLEGAFGEKVSLKLKWLFLKFKILPTEKKEKEPKTPKKEKKAETKTEEEQKPEEKKKLNLETVLSILELVKEALSSLKNPLGWFLRRIDYRDLWLHILVCRSDAHQTALHYGQCQAVVHGAFAVLRNTVDIQIRDIQIKADFVGEEEKIEGGGKLKLRPINALILVLWFAGRFGISYLKNISRDKKLNKELKAQYSNKNNNERADS